MGTFSGLGESYYIVGATRALAGDITCSQLHYHPLDPTPAEVTAGFLDADDFEFIELMNISGHAINIEGLHFTTAVSYTVPIGPLAQMAAGERVLIAKSTAAFLMRYGAPVGARLLGQYTGNFNNRVDQVVLAAANGSVIFDFYYAEGNGWPVEPDGDGPSLILRAPTSNPNLGDRLNWRPSTVLNGLPNSTDALTYTVWKATNTVPDDTTDTDHDGLLPIVEYALGADPSAPSLAALPTFEKQPDGQIKVQFSRALTADDVKWELQEANDLGVWTPAFRTVDARTFTADKENLTLLVPPTNINPQRRFLRVKFTGP
jgi:hypothetical protein